MRAQLRSGTMHSAQLLCTLLSKGVHPYRAAQQRRMQLLESVCTHVTYAHTPSVTLSVHLLRGCQRALHSALMSSESVLYYYIRSCGVVYKGVYTLIYTSCRWCNTLTERHTVRVHTLLMRTLLMRTRAVALLSCGCCVAESKDSRAAESVHAHLL